MAENDPHDVWHSNGTPEPQLETVDERLTKLEVAVASLTNPGVRSEYVPLGPPADGLAPGALVQAVLPALAAKAVDEAHAAAGGAVARLAVVRELQMMFRMYFDPRYRLSRVCQFAAPVLLALMVLNYLLFRQALDIWVVSPLFERLILVALAVALYKVLSREAARYASVLQYLAQYGR